jgi:hypothetical protein
VHVSLPVLIRGGFEFFLVLVPLGKPVVGPEIIEEVEPAVGDLVSCGKYFYSFAVKRNGVGTPPAIGRLIFAF